MSSEEIPKIEGISMENEENGTMMDSHQPKEEMPQMMEIQSYAQGGDEGKFQLEKDQESYTNTLKRMSFCKEAMDEGAKDEPGEGRDEERNEDIPQNEGDGQNMITNPGATGNGAPPPGNDPNLYCYQEYCRLYYANIILTNQLKVLLTEKNDLQNKLKRLESNKRKHEDTVNWSFQMEGDDKKKMRHRRTAVEISRHYKCPIETCLKSYGSEGSLNQHVKLKHPEYISSFFLKRSEQQESEGGVNNSNPEYTS